MTTTLGVEKRVTFDRSTRDYACYLVLDGEAQYIGSAATYSEGETTCDAAYYDMIEYGTMGRDTDLTPEEAEEIAPVVDGMRAEINPPAFPLDEATRDAIERGILSDDPREWAASEPLPFEPEPTRADIHVAYRRYQRAAAYARDDHRCVCCGTADNLTVHHIRPKVIGGSGTKKNLATVCRVCHDQINQQTQELGAWCIWFVWQATGGFLNRRVAVQSTEAVCNA